MPTRMPHWGLFVALLLQTAILYVFKGGVEGFGVGSGDGGSGWGAVRKAGVKNCGRTQTECYLFLKHFLAAPPARPSNRQDTIDLVSGGCRLGFRTGFDQWGTLTSGSPDTWTLEGLMFVPVPSLKATVDHLCGASSGASAAPTGLTSVFVLTILLAIELSNSNLGCRLVITLRSLIVFTGSPSFTSESTSIRQQARSAKIELLDAEKLTAFKGYSPFVAQVGDPCAWEQIFWVNTGRRWSRPARLGTRFSSGGRFESAWLCLFLQQTKTRNKWTHWITVQLYFLGICVLHKHVLLTCTEQLSSPHQRGREDLIHRYCEHSCETKPLCHSDTDAKTFFMFPLLKLESSSSQYVRFDAACTCKLAIFRGSLADFTEVPSRNWQKQANGD